MKGNWLGDLDRFEGGVHKYIICWHPNRVSLLNELSKAPIGYLVTRPRFIEMLFSDGDVEFLAKNGNELFIPQAEELGPELRNSFRVQNIPVPGEYCVEVGLIGCECDSVLVIIT